MKVAAHSVHGTWSDAARMISEFPQVPYALPVELQRGFTRAEVRMLGHWLRDKNAPDDPAPPRGARPAQPPGGAQQRQEMLDAYTRGAGRLGERTEQITVRRRIVAFIRAALTGAGCDWRTLKGDITDWSVVVAEGPSPTDEE